MKPVGLFLILLISCNDPESAPTTPTSKDGTEVNDTVPITQGIPPNVEVIDSLIKDSTQTKPR